MAIKDWPEGERPRERMAAHGPQVLSDAELLAIILRTGTSGQSALDLGRAALARFGGLSGLLAASTPDLAAIDGLGPAKRAQLQAVLELARRSLREEVRRDTVLSSPGKLRDYLMPDPRAARARGLHGTCFSMRRIGCSPRTSCFAAR